MGNVYCRSCGGASEGYDHPGYEADDIETWYNYNIRNREFEQNHFIKYYLNNCGNLNNIINI